MSIFSRRFPRLPGPDYPSPVRRERYRLLMSLLVPGLLACYLAGNGGPALFDRDEPRYAVTSRAMLQSGDWVVPRFLGKVRTAKPPMVYWLQASAMRVIGQNEFAVRLPGAIACAATVALLAATLPRIVGRRRAAWACFILGTSVLVLGVAKVGVIDGLLLSCAATIQVCLLYLLRNKGRRPLLIASLWCAVGVGGLLKGPVILGMLVATLVAWWMLVRYGGGASSAGARPSSPRPFDSKPAGTYLLDRSTSARKSTRAGTSLLASTHPLLGVGIISLIVLPWLIAIHVREPTFLATSIGHDVIARSGRGLEGHGQPPGFHLLALFGTWFPWSVLLPGTMWQAWKRRGQPWVTLALAACLGPWVMFELVVTKLPHYLLPIFPMLALLTADWLVRATRGRFVIARAGLRTAAGVFALVALGFAVASIALRAPSAVAVTLGLAWAGGLAVTWWRGRLRAGVIVAGVGMALTVAVAYVAWLPRVATLNVSRRVAEALDDAGAARAAMAGYKEPSLAWYAGQVGTEVFEATDAEALSGSTGVEFVVTTRDRHASVPAADRAGWLEVARIATRLYNDGLRVAEVLVLRRNDTATQRGEAATTP